MRDLSSCITENINGSEVVRSRCENEERILFTLISIIFDSIKHDKYKIDCYFSTGNHYTKTEVFH